MGNLKIQPWGLSRATRVHVGAPLYELVEVDPETQLSVFFDEHGEIIDAKKEPSVRRYQTVSMSKPHDGGKDAPNVADDSDNDREND
ncbi:putative ATP-grasp-modified RiPP [Sphaerisporangium sp. NPDC051011]|uniref:putative ATP-grasp-modified RiPP n=1 Tax=Sphaerisporangium sp. NPDC051011 TaxID=3155792 RepID=UPI00340F7C48